MAGAFKFHMPCEVMFKNTFSVVGVHCVMPSLFNLILATK